MISRVFLFLLPPGLATTDIKGGLKTGPVVPVIAFPSLLFDFP